MIPQPLINVLQIGLKYMVDLDPTLTEHFARYTVAQIIGTCQTVLDTCHNASELLKAFSTKCDNYFAPVVEAIKSVKLNLPEP